MTDDLLTAPGAVRGRSPRVPVQGCLRQALATIPDRPAPGRDELERRAREMGLSALLADREAMAALDWFYAADPDEPAQARDLVGFLLVLGTTLAEVGRWVPAIEAPRLAVDLEPGHHFAHNILARTLLSVGRFDEGWAGLRRWRELVPDYWPAWVEGWPWWAGDGALDVRGRRVLVYLDWGGLGDVIMYARYFGLLRRAGAAEVLALARPPSTADTPNARALPLLARCCPAVDRAVEPAEGAVRPGADFDLAVNASDLPVAFGPNDRRPTPWPGPYLVPDPRRVAAAREARPEGLLVGIHWSSNDECRSFPLAEAAPLAEALGEEGSLVSLQRGPAAKEAEEVDFPIAVLSDNVDAGGAFLDTSAAMMSLDLVVSNDTSVLHLAGALARPTWAALIGPAPDWRWSLDRTSWPLYPTVRQYRQPGPGDWRSVFERMAGDLRRAVPCPS